MKSEVEYYPLNPSSIREVFAEIQREELRKRVILGDVPSLNSPENSSTLAAKGNQGHESKMKKGRSWSEHCRRPSHTHETCWKIHGKPNDWKLKKYGAEKENCGNAVATDESKMTESIPFSKEQMEA